MTKDNQRLRIHTTLAVEVCRLLSQSSDILLDCIPVISRYLAWNIYRGLPTKKRLTFPRPAFVSSSARPVCITEAFSAQNVREGPGTLITSRKTPGNWCKILYFFNLCFCSQGTSCIILHDAWWPRLNGEHYFQPDYQRVRSMFTFS